MSTISTGHSAIGGIDTADHASVHNGYVFSTMSLYSSAAPWSDALTLPPIYSPAAGQPSEVPPSAYGIRRGSYPETPRTASRRGSSVGLVSAPESQGPWSSPGSEQATSNKSPLSGFSFFKNLGEKKTTRDGQAPKRRGPKPDSKPALTRRQELNRQAQRTHRERKEMYIKALEQEVMRLRETFTTTARERDAMAEENRRLKELLAAHGIAYDLNSPGGPTFTRVGNSTYGGSTADSVSGSISYGQHTNSTGYTSPPIMSGTAPSMQVPGVVTAGMPMAQRAPHQTGLDYDQIGIDFVLTLEKPCMDHMQMLCVRSTSSPGEEVSGHALMASCPPESHIANNPDEPYPHKMPDIGMPDLMKLLDLSNRLPLDGEITPIMAWANILQHPQFDTLTAAEFEAMKNELLGKIRCYGFGAVLEEFEVRDVISHIFAARGEPEADA